MTSTPENIVDVLAEHAIAGLMTRLQWMTLTPKSIYVMGKHDGELSATLQARFPEAEMNGENPDVIIANLELPWHTDMEAVIKAWRAMLQTGGLIMFTAFGPDTLKEWPDQNTCLVNRIDMHEIGDMLLQAGLADPVMEVEQYTISYADADKMLRELIDGNMVVAGPTHQIVSCELVYGHAWKAGEEVAADEDGVVKIPLRMLREQLRRSGGPP